MKKAILILIMLSISVFSYSITTFNDSTTSKTFNFTEAGSNASMWITLPKNASVQYAYFDLEAQPVANWTNSTFGNQSETMYDIMIYNTSLAYSVGNPPGTGGSGSSNPSTFFKWNGSAWAFVQNFDATRMMLYNLTYGFAVDYLDSPNLISFFNGTAWSDNKTLDSSITLYGVDIDPFNSSHAFAVGANNIGQAKIFEFNGTDWNEDTIPSVSTTLYSVAFSTTNPSELAIAVGSGGHILEWNTTNWTEATSPTTQHLLDVSTNSDYAYAVGDDGTIIKRSGDTDTWSSITSPVSGVALYSIDFYYEKPSVSRDGAIAVGEQGTIIETKSTNNQIWENVSSPTTKTLWTVDHYSDTLSFAVGDNMTFIRYYGYPNWVSLGFEDEKNWNNSKAELRTATANLTQTIQDVFTTDTNLQLNLSTGTPAYITLSNINISYGTQLTGVASGLSFKLSDGTDVSTTPVYENSNVSVYNGSTLVAVIPIDFSVQPNYSGWVAEAGVNDSDDRAYVLTSPLSDANNSQASSKTLYLKYSNTTATKVCVADSSTVTAADLKAIVTESDCTGAGYSLVSANTTEVGGVTYFALTGLSNSGAVQVVNSSAGSNPPILTDASVSPSSGNSDTSFNFSVTVTDLDNDSQSVSVSIDGVVYTMSEVDSSDTTTSDGKAYYYVTQLSQGTHTYYFSSNDGSNTAYTTSYSLTVGAGTPIIVSAPGFNYLAVLVLFLAVSLIYYKLN